jgi:N-acetylglucosaminyldiphosphoundecaprenol N-acetyl-beta-D-mannosaminyltransferase
MTSRVSLFGIQIDPLRMPEAVARVLEWSRAPEWRCRIVVTPNVDHVVMLEDNEAFRRAYADADLVLADGMPVVLSSKLLRKPLPERVTGADLVPAVFAGAQVGSAQACGGPPLRVFLLGAAPGVGDRAAARIGRDWPAVEAVGTYSPPLGFERDDAENRRILELVAAAEPDVLVVGLGAPKQELWVHAHRAEIRAKVALCVGAAIDFLAGNKGRAPHWMRRCGLEWMHRVCTEPRRLAARYARDAWIFPRLVWREWRSRRTPAGV